MLPKQGRLIVHRATGYWPPDFIYTQAHTNTFDKIWKRVEKCMQDFPYNVLILSHFVMKRLTLLNSEKSSFPGTYVENLFGEMCSVGLVFIIYLFTLSLLVW